MASLAATAGSLATFSMAATSVFVTSAGTPAGAKNANHTPRRFCLWPSWARVGISEKPGNVFEMTIPRSAPLFRWLLSAPSEYAPPSTCPPSSAVMPGAPPLNGTMVMPAPVSELIISMLRCPTEPVPTDPARTLPGCFLANSTISGKLR